MQTVLVFHLILVCFPVYVVHMLVWILLVHSIAVFLFFAFSVLLVNMFVLVLPHICLAFCNL